MTDREECYVRLGTYTLGVVVGSFGRRWWAPLAAPVVLDFPAIVDGHCYVTVRDETTLMTHHEAEQILIEHGLIDPAHDDPATPVYPWTVGGEK
jgi:hypothetical protein